MKNIIYAVTMSIFTALCAVPVNVTAADGATIDIAASNWKFTPGTITVHLNQTTTLRLTSKEGVHGLASSDLALANTVILPDKTVTVTFTPHKTGTYEVHCAVPCGPGHSDMKLIVKVVE